jgi:hypothetical protein
MLARILKAITLLMSLLGREKQQAEYTNIAGVITRKRKPLILNVGAKNLIVKHSHGKYKI